MVEDSCAAGSQPGAIQVSTDRKHLARCTESGFQHIELQENGEWRVKATCTDLPGYAICATNFASSLYLLAGKTHLTLWD